MNGDFIRILDLQGELKWYHKRKDLAATVSTKEFVLQKPHVNYYVKLSDILSIVPFEPGHSNKVPFINQRVSGNEITYLTADHKQYCFQVRKAVMHNRSGLFQMGASTFIIPVIHELLQAIAEYGGMNAVGTS